MPADDTLTELLDVTAIHDLTTRFADCCITQDYDAFAGLWAPDGVWAIAAPFAGTAEGTGPIVEMLRTLWNGNDHFVQFVVPGVVTLDGDRATARTVCHEAARGPNGRYYRNNGIWTDQLRRTGTGWVFTRRTYDYLWLDMSPFTGDTFPFPPVQR